MRGAKFSLREFHDSFMKQGYPAHQDRAARHVGQRFTGAVKVDRSCGRVSYCNRTTPKLSRD